jgi:hypothetical protein
MSVAMLQHLQMEAWIFMTAKAYEAHLALFFGLLQCFDDAALGVSQGRAMPKEVARWCTPARWRFAPAQRRRVILRGDVSS